MYRLVRGVLFCLAVGISSSWGQVTNLAVIYSFGTNQNQGFSARSALIQASDDFLYGTTWSGGTNESGTVFKISTNGTGYTVLHHFTDGWFPEQPDGSIPVAALHEGIDGVLYGTTYAGSVFRINKNGSGYTNLILSPGLGFAGSIVQATNRLLFGTDAFSGTNFQGEIFRITTNGLSFTNLHYFSGGLDATTTDGSGPESGMIIGSDGLLYGTSAGVAGVGTIYRLTQGGTNYTILKRFDLGAATNGLGPRSDLLEGSDGMLYGTTASGGNDDAGTIFKMNKSGSTFTVLYRFDVTNGSTPYHAALVQAANGVLYGTASQGASNGVVFRISTNGTAYTVVHSFQSGDEDGATPVAGLLEAKDGTFYGTTQQGGPGDGGVIYRVAKPKMKPLVTGDLEPQTNYVGSMTVFRPIGISDTNVFYQWLKASKPLSGHRESVLIFTNTALTNAGTYSIQISNVFGVVTSSIARLTVVEVPPEPVLIFGPTLSNMTFTARYSGAPGTNYTVEFASRFPGTNWVKLTNMTAPAVNQGLGVGVFQLTQPIIFTNRYYRVRWPSY